MHEWISGSTDLHKPAEQFKITDREKTQLINKIYLDHFKSVSSYLMFFYISCNLWCQKYIRFVWRMADVNQHSAKVVMNVQRIIYMVSCVVWVFGIYITVFILCQENVFFITTQLDDVTVYNIHITRTEQTGTGDTNDKMQTILLFCQYSFNAECVDFVDELINEIKRLLKCNF